MKEESKILNQPVVVIEPVPSPDLRVNDTDVRASHGSFAQNGFIVEHSPHANGGLSGSYVPRTPTPIGYYDTGEGVTYKFRPFTEDSYQRLLLKEAKLKAVELEKKNKVKEGRLVDGELKWDDDEEEERPKRDQNLIEGNNLSDDLDVAFPKELVGKPIEEIDPYLNDKVRIT